MNLIKRTKQWIQSGRIMMEMLGVLALIGLLTLGFIFYQKALLADRVNRLMEDARLAGLVVLDGVYKKLTVNEELSLKGQFEQQTPYNFSAYLEGEELKTFVVLADGVPYDVCREVQDRHPQWAEEIIANKLQNQCFAEMDNIVGFFYNDELTNNMDSCKVDADCGECGECKNHLCSRGIKNQSGECKSCDISSPWSSWIIGDVGEEECHKCKNRIYDHRHGGRCLANLGTGNSGGYWYGPSREECEKFPKHYFASYSEDCFYCEGTFNRATGVCETSTCTKNPFTSAVFGLDESTCITQCGGTFRSFPMDGGIVNVCYIP
ncbi:MAG: hypothetical protein J6P93_01295 [Alphaproteobacteria bacterium]|nr:hypothetical protein [Alphaproteobacteria bacterium]